jgi:UDP-2,3-diacylglucosamine pyrophosphatase LpxH
MVTTDHRVHCRSLFLSDIHLGTPGCQAGLLADLLATVSPEQLFLLGDIVDIERLQAAYYWPAAHEAIVASVLALAADGTRVVFVPGNHDAALRAFCGSRLGPVEVHRTLVHETADGRRLLLAHGDDFDVGHHYSPAVAQLAEVLYGSLLRLSTLIHAGRDRLGLPYWSLLRSVKLRLQAVREAVARYEARAVAAALDAGVDGIVCGHIHRPASRQVGSVHYLNSGDWVEHCTAVVEHADGGLELIDWSRDPGPVRLRATSRPAAAAA